MRKLFSALLPALLIILYLASPVLSQNREKKDGWCEQGNVRVTTAGQNSSTKVQQSLPACTVAVYVEGTLTLANIYSDIGGTPKANPFTADNSGYWGFFADVGRYDLVFSGGSAPNNFFTPFTRSSVPISASQALTNLVTGPGSSTNNAVTRFDGTSGKLIKNSSVILDDAGNFSSMGTLNGHSIPAAAPDTFLLASANQVIGGKIIISSTNTIGGVTMTLGSDGTGDTYYRSAGGQLTRLGIGSAGQVYTVSGGGLPSWGTVVSPPFIDTTDLVKGSGDATKILRFEVDGFTTATTRTLTPQNASYSIAGIDISNAWSDNVTQTFNPGASAAGLNVGSHTTDPSGANNGDLYYNSVANELRARISGVWIALGSGGGGGGGGAPGGSNGNIQYRVNASTFGGMVGTTVSTVGELLWSPSARTGNAVAYFDLNTPPDTTLSADTEHAGVEFGETATVRQWTQAGGSFLTQREYVFRGPTYAFTSADSIQDVATVAIQNSPTAGTNATFSNVYSLWVQAGVSNFSGKVLTNVTGSTLAAIRIGVKADPDPSTPLNGDMYYNTTNNKFRCYQNSAWTDCIAASSGTIGGSIAANQLPFGTGANTIGGEAGFSYDPATNVFRISNTGVTAAVDWFLDTDAGANPRVKWQGNTNTINYAWFNNGGTDELFRISRFGEVFTLAKNRGTSTTLPYFQVVSPADTAQAADTERQGIVLGDNPVYTRQWTAGGGTFSLQREVVVTQPRYSFTSADTIVRATTFTILGAPIAFTNATITTAEAFRVEAGATSLNGALSVVATAATDGGISFIGHSVGFVRQHASTQTIPWITVDSGAISDLTTGVDIKEIWYRFDNGDFNYSTAATTSLYESILIAKRNITGDVATRTITTGITFSVDGPPTAGANAAITNPLTAAFKSGTVRFGTPSSQTGIIQLAVSGDADMTTLSAGDTPASSVRYKWPADDPAATEQLTVTSFSGGVAVLEWAAGGGGGGSPGGASGTIQWNNAGAFAGISGSSVDANGIITLSPSTATTNAVVNTVINTLNSSGTAADNFGQAYTFNLESSTTNGRNAMKIQTSWLVALDGDRTSEGSIWLTSDASALTDYFSVRPRGTTLGADFVFGPIQVPSTTGGLNWDLYPAFVSGTNIAGSVLTLAGGPPTGTGVPGHPSIRYGLQSTSSGTSVIFDDTFAYRIPSAQFTKTSTSTVSNTTSLTTVTGSIFPSGGDLLEAGLLQLGRTITVDMYGTFAIASSSTLQIGVRINDGSPTTFASVTRGAIGTIGTTGFHCTFTFTVRTFGSSGTGFGQGVCHIGAATPEILTTTASATFTEDFSAQQTVEPFVQWGVANAGNTISITNMRSRIDN